MTFKRLLVWLLEKLVELHLAVAVVLLVSTLLPAANEAYSSFTSFGQAVVDNIHNAKEDATYMTQTFMDGSYATYALKTYLACVYVIGFYVYLASLYLFTSLLACLFDHRHYALSAVLAFTLSVIVFCVCFVPVFDAAAIRTGIVLFALGLGIVFGCAVMGERLMAIGTKVARADKPAKSAKPSKRKGLVTGRVRLDLSE